MSDAPDDMRLPEADARLLDELGRALGPDLPPAGLVARAEGLVAFMDVDRELVALLDEAAEPVGSRGAGTRDRLGFELGDGSVSLELAIEDGALVGQLLAGEVVEIELEGTDGVLATTAPDELGRFSLRSVPTGPARLRLRDGSGRPLATDWFLL